MLEQAPVRGFDNREALETVKSLLEVFKRRRSIRDFSDEEVDEQIIDSAIQIAGLAPNGANRQPWIFCVISDSKIKGAIRGFSEKEEKRFYQDPHLKNWQETLQPLHTNQKKEFLEKAPFLIAVFARNLDPKPEGGYRPNYYVRESVGIATGFLIATLHLSGVSVLTYTPTKMEFLRKLLNRPRNEKPFMLLAVGRPSPEAKVPSIDKKSLDEILARYH
jgi:nitroreductase